ncbi:MAG: lipid II flippase MurJ [Bryobacteraceae bacterium]|jgi:putative peptidoglycan lipid II flippase
MQPSPASDRLLARAAESPLVRGGLTVAAGILAGNVLGFVRVALTAYLLGTHSQADSLAVALGPIDTLNGVLINSMLFAFVPALTAAEGASRIALFRSLLRLFGWVYGVAVGAVILTAPWIMKVLAPGLDAPHFAHAVTLLRILALSSLAAGSSAAYSALLYTARRFGPAAYNQALLNLGTIACALLLWKWAGVYAFAIGYTVGAWTQLGITHLAARKQLAGAEAVPSPIRVREILARPAFFMVYAVALGLNMTFTRAWATHAGPGMAAAFDYCMRGVGVPLALLVTPVSSSLLPEIARLHSLRRMREALRLIDRTVILTALLAVSGCVFAIAFRTPAIRLFFQRGSFTGESTRLVSEVFLGLAPSLIGWGLMEILARSMFALERRWPPVLASVIPLLVNVSLTLRLGLSQPQYLGAGASAGLLAGCLALFAMTHLSRRRESGGPAIA